MADKDIVVKIKADGSNAEAELRKVEAHLRRLAGGSGVAGVQKGFKEASSQAANFVSIITGDRLTGATSQLTAFSGAIGGIPGPAGLAIGAVVGLTAAGVALGAGIFAITKNAADYAATFKDAQDATGLTAQSLVTLKYNADNAGSSFEQVISSTEKFSKLIGQAADGNEQAQQTLKALGVTSYNLDEALSQVTSTIAKAADGTEQITLAQKAFGKSGADLIPVIKQMGGDLDDATKEAERLGITLTDKDIAAADDFGDALGTLGSQAQSAAVIFTSDLMPVFTRFFESTAEWYGENQQLVRIWGGAIGEVATTVGNGMSGLGQTIDFVLSGINNNLGINANKWDVWSGIARAAIAAVTLGASELNRILNPTIGAQIGGKVGAQVGVSVPNLSGGGGGGKGGGGGGGKPNDAFAQAKKNTQLVINEYKQSATSRTVENERALEKMTQDEYAHLAEKYKIIQETIAFEREQYEKLLQITSINAEQRQEIEGKIDELRSKSYQERVKEETEFTKLTKKENDEQYETYKKRLENERKRDEEHRQILKERKERANREAKTQLSDSEKDRIKTGNDQNLSILGDSILSIRNEAGNLENTFKPTLAVFQMMGNAVSSLAQGFGSLVEQMVLTGSAGPHAMRKLVASVLAGVAAQAATLAIMETAYGIAALTHWGRAIYGDPVKHFKAAALFGAVAVTTGLIGRAVAGNTFSAGGGGGGSNEGAPDYYTSPPTITRNAGIGAGSGPQKGNVMQRIADALERLEAVPPDYVVQQGIRRSPGMIGNAAANDVRRDSGIGRKLLESSGFR